MKSKRFLPSFLVAAAAVLLAGCLPIEMGVSGDGRVLIPRQEGFFIFSPATGKLDKAYVPAAGKPMFAKFMPDGKSILAVTESAGGMMGAQQEFALVTPGAAPAPLVLAAVGNATYACVSPDGKTLSITRLSDQKNAAVGENMPELVLVDVASGTRKNVAAASAVAVIHRWFPNSKSLLVFQITGKDQKTGKYDGVLGVLDVAAGTLKPLAAAKGGKDVFFDLSPDGRTAIFTASAAGKPGTALQAGNGGDKLFALSLADGSVREVKSGVKYALWSPKGTHVLAAVAGEDDQVTLQVADAAMTAFKPVATDAVGQVGGGPGSSTSVYPSWLGEDRVLYLASCAVYGTAGKNLQLVSVGADGSKRKNMQAAIDAEAARASEAAK